jgi:hypothetical protein
LRHGPVGQAQLFRAAVGGNLDHLHLRGGSGNGGSPVIYAEPRI